MELFSNDQERFVNKLLSLKRTDKKAVKKALDEKNSDTLGAILSMNHYLHWSFERQMIGKRMSLYRVKHHLEADREIYHPDAEKEEY